MALSQIHLDLVASAMQAIRTVFPGKEEHEYRRAESTLKTHVKRMRKGNTVTWSLSVPELNQMFVRKETVNV